MTEEEPTASGGDGGAICPPKLEPFRCRECGRHSTALQHSPMALTSCCYEHVPAAPGDLHCPTTCFSWN